MRIGLLGVLGACSFLYGGSIDSSSFPGASTLITFDNLTGGGCNLCGPQVTNQYASKGVTFNNPSFPGEDTADTNLTSGIPDSSSTNALYIKQGGHIGDPPAAPFQILFTTPVTMVGFDYGSSPESFLKIDAYSSDNVLLETLTYIGDPTWLGLGGFAGIDESTDIARVDVSYHPNYDPARTFNFSIADLRFADNCVPEPATPALVAIGICTIVLGRRKLLVSRV